MVEEVEITPGYGWLARRDELPWSVYEVALSEETKTRREEYTFVADVAMWIDAFNALDVATGYVPGWHILPEVLSGLFYKVTTIDHDPRTLAIPDIPIVTRTVGDMCDMSFEDESFDLVTCISTFEHLTEADRIKAASEIARVAKDWLVMTADELSYLPRYFYEAFDVGTFKPLPAKAEMLDPAVFWLVARKRR